MGWGYAPLGTAAVLILVSAPARAVRPFVTDDARITDVGQFEIESWAEFNVGPGGVVPAVQGMAGITVNNWLQILAGGGVGLDPGGRSTITNPVLQPKILFLEATEDGRPGVGLALGVTAPVGRGSLFDDATGWFAFAPVSVRLLDDWLLLHGNLGGRGAFETGGHTVVRPYWGVGAEVGVVVEEARLVVEAYAGDPFEATGPPIATQFGGRWLKSDHVNLDLTFGLQPVLGPAGRVTGEIEWWGQIGLRVLFDAFRDTPGDPAGAPGMFRRRR